MTFRLADFSESIISLVSAAAPFLTAIRLPPNRHVTGLMCPGGLIVTADQALPALETYTVVLPNRTLAPAQPGRRDSSSGLAVLQLDADVSVGSPDIGATALGAVAVLLGADADASPTVRLTLIHRFIRTGDGQVAVLDLPADSLNPGSVVLDAHGRLIGLAALGSNGEAIVIPAARIGLMPYPREWSAGMPSPNPAPDVFATPLPRTARAGSVSPNRRRGWLGIGLQPITVPDQLVGRVGQVSGRMVVAITPGGPADQAGLRVGDVLLTFNGATVGGEHNLRNHLAEERIGGEIAVKLLRDGNLLTARLVVAVQP
nr:PDZ domain-containing protein [uncultured Rhodopila sp.]